MSPAVHTPRLFRTLWLLAGLALALGLGREAFFRALPQPRELPRLDRATGRPWIEGGFHVAAAGRSALDAGLLPPGVQTADSSADGDDWQGRAATAWFRATRAQIHVGIAGHPQHPRCALHAEFRHEDDSVTRVACDLPDPGLEWNVWEIARPASAVAVRVVAEDNAGGPRGWLAFSHPFRATPGWIAAAYQGIQILTTAVLALVLVWGPGLLLAPRCATPALRTAALAGAGPLLLALLGVIIWGCSPGVPPRAAALVLVGGLWLTLGAAAWRRRFELSGDRPLGTLLGLSALVAAAVIARSASSAGPSGELFPGAVSRNFELSDRIDSRFSFYTVQAAAHGQGPTAPAVEKRFHPWTFFSRGPLAGLAAVPVVLATQGQPPEVLPNQRWSPFDRTGFAAYRITLVVLASTVIVAFGLVVQTMAGDVFAVTGAGLLALCPFAVHEVLFTWPKWPATTALLVSFGLAHARRPFAAGLAIGVGFLFHPLALLWSPWIGLWAGGRAAREAERNKIGALLAGGLRCAAGAGALVLPWMALGALMPHLPGALLAGQGGFLQYWTRADSSLATWDSWWRARWLNFANTFVPLHLPLHPPSFHHPKLGSAYEASGALVKFAEVWWNTLPFGLGLGLWGVALAGLGRAWRVLRAAAWLLVIAPAAFIVAYWGMDPLGLMRECGHPLLVGILGVTCTVAARDDGRLRRLLLHPATPWLQLPETWLMLWLTTWFNTSPRSVEHPHLDPLYFALTGLALAAAAWVLARFRLGVAADERAPSASSARASAWGGILPAAGFAALAFTLPLLVPDPPPRQAGNVTLLAALPRDGAADNEPASFTADGVWLETRRHDLPANAPTWGSWIGSDEFRGEHRSPWFSAAGSVTVMVAGNPSRSGNRLQLELRRKDGTVDRLAHPGPDPGEHWTAWNVAPGPGTEALRIAAVDAATGHGGWLAFSAPFHTPAAPPAPSLSRRQLVGLSLLTVLAAGLAVFAARHNGRARNPAP